MIPLYDTNPRSRTPWVTIGLIALNVIAFGFQLMAGASGPHGFEEVLMRGGLIPAEILHGDIPPHDFLPPPLTAFTAMFLHGDVMHIGGNMLYLWIFGDNVEDLIGPFWYIVFYVFAGLAAAILQVVFSLDSPYPMIGASGAIAGILGAYLVLFPKARVRTLVLFAGFGRLAEIPASVVLGFWIFLQVVYVLLGSERGVALWAHIGGFAFGALVALAIIRPLAKNRIAQPWNVGGRYPPPPRY